MTGEETSWLWAVGLIAFASGIVVGGIVAMLLTGNNRRAEQLQQELDRLQNELDDYRGQVSRHFMRTSELVQQMTQSYREVYEHLASGSQQLCKNTIETPRLDIPEQAGLLEPAPAPSEDQLAPADFSDAETDSLQTPELDEYLGETPQVPDIDNPAPDAKDTTR